MGEAFFNCLKDGKFVEKVGKSNFLFTVFGLGSSAYPKFCQFGKDLDELLQKNGGSRVYPMGFGDEEKNQKASFKTWVQQALIFILNSLSITASETGLLEVFSSAGQNVEEADYKWAEYEENMYKPLNETLSSVHNRSIREFHMKNKTRLHEENESKVTLVEFSADLTVEDYAPGDHMGVCPQNSPETISYLKDRLIGVPKSGSVLIAASILGWMWKTFPNLLG